MLYLTIMRGKILDLTGIEIGVVTEGDGAGTSLPPFSSQYSALLWLGP